MNPRLFQLLSKLEKELPKFEDGRINYANANEACVLSIFVYFRGKILLLKRSKNVASYRELWDSVAGYYDEFVPAEQKVLEELNEELGIKREHIAAISFAELYDFKDGQLNILWHILPVLVELKELPKIKLNDEHTTFVWIRPEELSRYAIVPGLEISLQRALSAVKNNE